MRYIGEGKVKVGASVARSWQLIVYIIILILITCYQISKERRHH